MGEQILAARLGPKASFPRLQPPRMRPGQTPLAERRQRAVHGPKRLATLLTKKTTPGPMPFHRIHQLIILSCQDTKNSQFFHFCEVCQRAHSCPLFEYFPFSFIFCTFFSIRLSASLRRCSVGHAEHVKPAKIRQCAERTSDVRFRAGRSDLRYDSVRHWTFSGKRN